MAASPRSRIRALDAALTPPPEKAPSSAAPHARWTLRAVHLPKCSFTSSRCGDSVSTVPSTLPIRCGSKPRTRPGTSGAAQGPLEGARLATQARITLRYNEVSAPRPQRLRTSRRAILGFHLLQILLRGTGRFLGSGLCPVFRPRVRKLEVSLQYFSTSCMLLNPANTYT